MKFSWIEAGLLAASGIPLSEDDIRSLHNEGIRAIVSLTEHPITDFRELPIALFHELDMVYYHSPIPDQYPPNEDQAAEILHFIQNMQEQTRPVLIHCHAGIGRTGTILHLYYISQGHSFEQAQSLVHQHRPQSTLLSDEQIQFLKQVGKI